MPATLRIVQAALALAFSGASPVPSVQEAPSRPAAQRTFIEPVSQLRFVLIPAGRFEMGSRFADTQPANDQRWFLDEQPPHSVTISQEFWLATTETTVAAFRRFVEETNYVTTAERVGESLGAYVLSRDAGGVETGQWGPGRGLTWRNPGWRAGDDHPVTHVSWTDAAAFVQWLRDKTGRPFRLPTEAEWEYAAGGPEHRTYSWGDGQPTTGREGNIADARFARAYPRWKYPVLASVDDGYVHTAPVASYHSNGFGLWDMSGNVWEWTADRYAADIYTSGSLIDPHGPSEGAERVHRGGGFDWELPYLRVAKRRRGAESLTAANIGFRIAL
jgi:formylglycine-generating enzyme